jgi:hypothetical protein
LTLYPISLVGRKPTYKLKIQGGRRGIPKEVGAKYKVTSRL